MFLLFKPGNEKRKEKIVDKSNVATASKNVCLCSRTKMTSNPRANKQSHRQRPMRPAGLRNGVELHGEVERLSSN